MGQKVFSAAKCLIQSPFKRSSPQAEESEDEEVNVVQTSDQNIKSRLRHRTSSSVKAGLDFPVSRVDRQLHNCDFRVSKNSSVFLSAVLQDLTSTVLTEAGAAVHKRKRRVIKPQDLIEAFNAVPELKELLKNCSVPKSDDAI
mmetsp:Transcript_26375/g.47346  ORF Transcript_26375/g.47346 Transcript_26375/m.47346 type:complete len:143 (-) Transcript_26375:316-744(-)